MVTFTVVATAVTGYFLGEGSSPGEILMHIRTPHELVTAKRRNMGATHGEAHGVEVPTITLAVSVLGSFGTNPNLA